VITLDPALFRADLEAKPATLRALAAHLATHRPWEFVRDTRRVVFLGMGSSRYAAQVAARRLRRAGVDASAEYASAEGTVPAGDDTLVVAISASGTSQETLDAVAAFPSYVALTNNPDSALARRAAHTVEMHAGAERGGVACRSFQHTQILLDALVDHRPGVLLDHPRHDVERERPLLAADVEGDALLEVRRGQRLRARLHLGRADLLEGLRERPVGAAQLVAVEHLVVGVAGPVAVVLEQLHHGRDPSGTP